MLNPPQKITENWPPDKGLKNFEHLKRLFITYTVNTSWNQNRILVLNFDWEIWLCFLTNSIFQNSLCCFVLQICNLSFYITCQFPEASINNQQSLILNWTSITIKFFKCWWKQFHFSIFAFLIREEFKRRDFFYG